MRYKFTKKYGDYYYRPNGTYEGMLCFDSLSKLFDLADFPAEIYIQVTEEPVKNSYFVRKDHFSRTVYVTLSNGDTINEFITLRLARSLLSKLPNTFYVSVIA